MKYEKFEITVDHTETLEQMILAGRYDWVNRDITTERFPLKGDGLVTRVAYLIHFDRKLSSDDVVDEIRRRGKRPASIQELLAFGARYPNIQRRFLVVALDPSAEVGDQSRVACLYRVGPRRYLGLVRWDVVWYAYSHFLVFNE